MISIPVDATLEAQAALVLNCIAVTAETAVRLLFVHLAEQGTLPDALKVSNAATRVALADAEAIMAKHRAGSPVRASNAGMNDIHRHDDKIHEDSGNDRIWRSAPAG